MLFFKKLRSSFSSPKDHNPSTSPRATSPSEFTESRTQNYHPKDTTVSTVMDISNELSPTESQDYAAFLEKSRREEERREKERLRKFKEAQKRRQEANMSPWAGRM